LTSTVPSPATLAVEIVTLFDAEAVVEAVVELVEAAGGELVVVLELLLDEPHPAIRAATANGVSKRKRRML
jgi:hypothetical protein